MAARGGTTKSRVAIPQLAWTAVRPAPVVLVSGPRGVLAERAIAMLRDALRAEDPALEVSDLEADGYARGDAAHAREPVAVRRAAPHPGRRRREGERRLPRRRARVPRADRRATTLVLRARGRARGKKLLDAIRGRAAAASRSSAPS